MRNEGYYLGMATDLVYLTGVLPKNHKIYAIEVDDRAPDATDEVRCISISYKSTKFGNTRPYYIILPYGCKLYFTIFELCLLAKAHTEINNITFTSKVLKERDRLLQERERNR